jgi:hypothetical protein
MELNQEDKAPRFYNTLRQHSQNQYDPISEWKYIPDVAGNGEGKCICSTPIYHEFVIQNKFTGHVLTIGSECIQRWFHSALTCERCSAALGNISNRIRNKNFLCACCNRLIKKRKKELGNQILILSKKHRNIYPKYYLMFFKDLIKDLEAIEILINLSEKNEEFTYLTGNLDLFEEYVGLHYKIELKTLEV